MNQDTLDLALLLALGLLVLVGVVTVFAFLVEVSRHQRVQRGEPADLGEVTDRLLTTNTQLDAASDATDSVVVDGPVVPGFLPTSSPPATVPIVVDGPPGARGRIPSGLRTDLHPSCSRCGDDGFLGGCAWCGLVPEMVNPPAPPVEEWAREWAESGRAHQRDGWRNQ